MEGIFVIHLHDFLIVIFFWQWDEKDIVPADMDRFVEDGSLDDNVESFLSHDDNDPRDTVGRCMDVSKGMSNGILPVFDY